MPLRSPSALETASPMAMPVSSVVWWKSIWRSPFAFTLRSIRLWRESCSSIWSRKPMPVEISDRPEPSRSTETEISVSLVLRSTLARRANACRMDSIWNRSCQSQIARVSYQPCAPEPSRPGLLELPLPLTYLSPMQNAASDNAHGMASWHGTTILLVRKGPEVVLAGDGQVTVGHTVMKSNARKLRRLGKGADGPDGSSRGQVIAGFAGATADALTLFERLEAKLEQHPGQLARACVELAKDWRTDRYLRRLEAMMAVADRSVSLVLTGTGDVLEPEDGLIGIGSGGAYALAAARALIDRNDLNAEDIARKAMKIAADICIYTNHNVLLEKL